MPKLTTGEKTKLKTAEPTRKARPVKDGVVPPEGLPKETKYTGPWYRVEADALHSRTFTGKVDMGTYRQQDKDKGLVEKRLEQVKATGYKNAGVKLIAAEVPEIEVYPEDAPSKIGRHHKTEEPGEQED